MESVKLRTLNRNNILVPRQSHLLDILHWLLLVQYRAPEEYAKDYLNEAIDVFSFGNNIYGLLTGLWVFYDTDDDPSVQSMVINGTRALIDPRWRERSFIESKLVDVMEQCWKSDIHERMDIFQAVQKLREVKKEYEKRKTWSLLRSQSYAIVFAYKMFNWQELCFTVWQM